MDRSLIPASLLLLFVPTTSVSAADPRTPPARGQFSQFSIHQRIIIRVPRIPDQPAPLPNAKVLRAPVWREKKTAKCVPMTSIAGASFTRVESIDLVIVDGRRIRARFADDCPSIDFYAGFYLKPTLDGAICAKRDSVRSRGGHACRIETFKELVRQR